MQYDYTEEQQLLKDSLRKFVRDHYDYESRRALAASEPGYSNEHWRQLAGLGVLGLPFAEEHGGLGGDIAYLMAVAEEFGRGLVLEPFFPCVVLAGQLLSRAENSALRERLLPQMVAGELIMSLAWEERASNGNPQYVETRAERDGSGFRLNGEKLAVLGAPQSQKLIVSARIAEGGGIHLFVVDIDAPGVSMQSYPTVDGQRAANMCFANVRVDESGALMASGTADELLTSVVREALVVLGAEACGVADGLLRACIEYCAVRQQFGLPLSAFQVLQHRLADMYIAKEKLRSLLWAAAGAVGTADGSRAVASLKAAVGEEGRFLAQQAVQLHGGIGMTDELSVGAWFKRLTVMDLLFGNRDDHLRVLA